MEKRKVIIEEKLIKELQELVKSFPIPLLRNYSDKIDDEINQIDFNRRMITDLHTYEANQVIIDGVIEERSKFFSTDDLDIDMSKIMVMPTTILEVELDVRVEKLIDIAMNLQHKFLDEIQEEIKKYTDRCR